MLKKNKFDFLAKKHERKKCILGIIWNCGDNVHLKIVPNGRIWDPLVEWEPFQGESVNA